MYVITADQIGSRRGADLVEGALAALRRVGGEHLPLPPERTAGDEVQAIVNAPRAALDLVLELARDEHWSIGLGIGPVRTPLPDSTRAGAGEAFVLAREAVEQAKRRPSRFRLRIADGAAHRDADLEPLIDLLLLQRERRSEEGWELHDLLAEGISQQEAARRLAITPQAVSQRARTAQLRTDDAARAALERLLDAAERTVGVVQEEETP
ncbi:DNA-binding protein [Homoserinibacter sp. YIM 151385]|uniref:DNA-binding protein n=1 Tax=Homoserinibacter sp. YIM 151385 TaxID=2985506 RepID=UPI0022F0A349|nr:DNA-binding protein [Homoserinibacter sp. YIM 151385]WBU38862.1 DNA-binding protein [Homoserinibacter sp. YIM 151385]